MINSAGPVGLAAVVAEWPMHTFALGRACPRAGEKPVAEFGLMESFEIDDGQLDNVSRTDAFAMGVEWQMFRTRLESGRPFSTLVIAENAERLTKLAERSRRFVESRPASGGWASLTVGDYLV